MKKRFLSVLLCVCMVLTLTPTMAFASEAAPIAAGDEQLKIVETGYFENGKDAEDYFKTIFEKPKQWTSDVGTSGNEKIMYVKFAEPLGNTNEIYFVEFTIDGKTYYGDYMEGGYKIYYWSAASVGKNKSIAYKKQANESKWTEMSENGETINVTENGNATIRIRKIKPNGETFESIQGPPESENIHFDTDFQLEPKKVDVSNRPRVLQFSYEDKIEDALESMSEYRAYDWKPPTGWADQTMWVTFDRPLGSGKTMNLNLTLGGTGKNLLTDNDGKKCKGDNTSRTYAWSFKNEKQVTNATMQMGTYHLTSEQEQDNIQFSETVEGSTDISLPISSVTLKENEDTLDTKAETVFAVADGQRTVKLPQIKSDTGKIFEGWQDQDNEGNVYNEATYTVPKSEKGDELTLTAKWHPIMVKTATPTSANEKDFLPSVNVEDAKETASKWTGQIKLSGFMQDPGTTGTGVTLDLTLENGNTKTEHITIKNNNGTLTAVPSSINVPNIQYDVDVSEITILDERVTVEARGVEIPKDVKENLTTGVTDELIETLGSENTIVNADDMTKAFAEPDVQRAVADVLKSEINNKVEALLKEANKGGGTYNTIDVVTYLEITPIEYKANENAGATKHLTLDITPKYKVVAKNGSQASDALVSGELGAEIKTGITITINVPTDFITGHEAYVVHETNGKVLEGDVSGTTVTFTSDGFSEYTIYDENPAVAEINRDSEPVSYLTLQAAVDAVGNDETIKLVDGAKAENAELTAKAPAKEIIFTVNRGTTDISVVKNVTITGTENYHVRKIPGATDESVTYLVTKDESSDNSGSNNGGSSGGSGSSGSGGSSASYTVSTASTSNGSFTVSDRYASAGKTVTITPKPNDGYIVDTVKVTDKNGNSIKVTKNADGTYSFVMPEKSAQLVKVEVTFKEDDGTGDHPSTKFTDVVPDAWYQTAVDYVIANGLMEGTSDTTFEPNTTTSRGMVVTILYRLEGTPSAASSGFPDVAAGQWYTDAVSWAATNGIVTGYDNGNFGPNDMITREQMATILYRYAGYKAYGTGAQANLASYTDASAISAYAESAMKWANAEGLITGTTATTLSPAGDASRAEVATILMRFCEEVVK